MKSKMWNKIFKNKSSKSSSVTTPTETNDEDDSNLYDNTHQQQVMIPSTSTSSSNNNNNHPHNNTTKSSKLSKMVNSFTLKRNSNKENGNNCINNNGGYNSDVAISIIRNAELNNEISKFNNYNNNNLNKNFKYMKRQKSIDHCDGNNDDNIIPIMDTTSKLIKTTPPDEIPLSSKLDFNDPNFPISPEPPAQIELHSCPICTRKFVPATLTKHVGICERMATKKRKKFDSFRQRREGTDLAAYLPKNFGITTTTANNPSKYKTVIEPKVLSPRIQVQESTPVPAHKQIESGSQNLQSSQRKTTLNPISPTSKPVRSKNVVKRLAPVSEQCPHCTRSFGIKAFDRHVDWCKEKSRLQAAKNNADLKTAKDRLEARTKYRAPNLKAKRETIRYKYSGNGDDGQSIDDNRSVDNNVFSMSNSLSSSFMSDGGFSDKYDPFLSAKRQLEELCSPTAETDSPFSTKQQHHQATSTPITIKPKLTSSLSTSYTAPSPNPRNTLNTVKSNFRRTSSLRSPRKNNPIHRPLFVPPSRCSRPTTIQRGISDEGPISTNFISTEEYDEMPVKSACINNFATAINSPQFSRRDSSPQKLLSRSTSRESSPLVIKRDPNTNLNRRNLRLNLGNNKELNNNSSSNNNALLKTDSLAVFLKYETELTKNPSDKLISSLNQLGHTSAIILPQQISSTAILPVENLISEKDWKDKSNTLSKQNSLKNSSSDLVEKTFVSVEKEKLTLLKNSLTNLLDSNSSGNNNNKLNDTLQKLPPTIASPADVNNSIPSVNKSLPIKLEPLHQNIYKYTATPPPSKTQSPPVVTPSLAPLFPQIKSTPMTVAINNNLINLNSILNIDSKEMDNNFIDPKLINICDNLQMTTTTNIKTTKESDDSDLTSIGSQDSAYRPKTAPNKFTDDSQSSGHQSSESVIEKSPTPPTTQQRKDQYQRQTSSNRNSSDKRNLLKRQIRLGKNQFLYDASPSDSEPSPDPIINKSQDDLLTSVASTTIHLPLVESSEKQFDSLLSPSNNPIFNDFDFEEFLSSFEASNDDDDDEQFPGFKDCKEFLMNRCLNMRSMNNNFINNNTNILNNTQNTIRSRKIELDPMTMLNDSNFANKNNNNNSKRQLCHDDDDDVQIVHDKREIFISIETDQNENETSNPCPNDPSIQNPKIEEINGNDNKFTKIETYHLPIFEEKDENLTTDFINDVTIRRNNVKNKQQNEEIKETIICDSVTSMYPVDSDERSSVECYPIGRRSVKSKASADSAYGSLSRQSPTLTDHSSLRRNSASRTNRRLPNEQTSNTNVIPSSNESKRRNRELSASSSGSENSLPPINNQHHSHHNQQQQQKVLRSYQEECNLPNSKNIFSTTTLDFGSLPSPSGGQQQQPMSKFCHECGNRFLVTQAKFCMECGVKRIVLK